MKCALQYNGLSSSFDKVMKESLSSFVEDCLFIMWALDIMWM